MHLTIIATVFPLVFLGELPDKTMFASLVMAARGHPFSPLSVWIGAALAFAIHVAFAVTVGVVLFHLLPHRAVEGLVAGLFLAGAVYSFAVRDRHDDEKVVKEGRSPFRTVIAAGTVIFLAEWGDLTQIITANLAARYHSPLSVGVGALLALWAVAAIAVSAGAGLLRFLSVRTIRLVTAAVLAALAVYTAGTAIAG